LYATPALKWSAVVETATRMRIAGRPVLIGTRSVAASEELSRVMASRALDHVVLNARQDKDEAQVVAVAGESGRITVATNMAGRGTDIRLEPAVAAKGGLHVVLTEFHESRRIDRQLFGRCARQGDAGSHEAIVCLEDELFVRHARRQTALLATRYGNLTEPLPSYAVQFLRMSAQRAAEAANSRIRRANLEMDWKLDSALAFAGKA
jgi:preprotein translocase subunit SecA